MRVRVMFGVAVVTVCAAAGTIGACGGVAETPETADASSATDGSAISDTGSRDSGLGVNADAADAAKCDLSTDFAGKIPDAALADGASSTGLCVACTKTNCKSLVDKCNGDCDCKGLADTALACFIATQDYLKCGAPFLSVKKETRDLGIGLVTCLSQSCRTECALDGFGASDAGDAGDSPSGD